MELLPHLSFQDAFCVIVAAALTTYVVFKQTETSRAVNLLCLLVVVPTLLSLLFVSHCKALSLAVYYSFGIYFTTIFTCILAYRLSPLHPLANYPGPLLCKVSKFRLAVSSYGGKNHLYIRKLHEVYGDVVRIGPNELSFVNRSAIEPILGQAGLPKGPYWDGRVIEYAHRSLISIRSVKEHRHRRQPWSLAFNSTALKVYEPLVLQRTSELMEHLEKHAANPVDFTRWMSYFTFDLMTDFAFSGGSHMMRDGDKMGIWNAIKTGLRRAAFMSQVPWLGAMMFRLPRAVFTDMKALRDDAFNRIAKRMQLGSQQRDLFYYLLDEANTDIKPQITQVGGDAGLAVLAGSDSTSTVSTILFYFLLSYPKVYMRLQQEVDAIGDGYTDPGKHTHMTYLNAVINETLRLYTPVLSGSQRAVKTSQRGLLIGSYFVPANSNVVVPVFVLHRDPRNFSPMPDSFIPERWLSEEEREGFEPEIFKDKSQFVHESSSFLAFSYGPANCVGKNLAYMEIRLLVCMMLKHFELRFANKEQARDFEKEIKDFYLLGLGKLEVLLTRILN